MSDPLKKIAEEIAGSVPKPKITKVTRSLSLENSNFKKLQAYCRPRGVSVSDVMDKLIAAFLENLPPEEQ